MARRSRTLIQRAALAGVVAVVLIVPATESFAAPCGNGPVGFDKWLQGFKQEAAAQGMSNAVIAQALDGVTYDPAVIAKDRGQSVFAQNFLQFSDRMVNGNRLSIGSSLLKKYADTFGKIQRSYGVPGPVLVGFWGLETDFGKVMGNMDTLRSLATLAYDCRRPDEFREQLLDALKVIQRGDLRPQEMRGPWAGEVGQFQFVPKVYFQYAVDLDGDGKRDTIHSTPDALASAANYLDGLGWKAGQPWLEEVRVAANMDWSQADVTIKKPRAYWAKSGVTYPSGKALPADNVPTALLLPMGRNGPAFLAYHNFDVYLQWNQSLVYSTSAAYYATRLAGAPPMSRGNAPIEPMSQAQVRELQQILAKRGFDVGKTDGVIGASTRDAVRKMQVKFGLPADGYPTPELLARLRGGG
jgi:lytic murein transglycosylase